jgi:hypothetical protein
MRYRWDPVYPMGRRESQSSDDGLRASDEERNAVADTLSRHFAEGRLDQAEFKTRLDAAMSATTRGELKGLFYDLPRLPADPPPPVPRRHRILPVLLMVALVAILAGAMVPWWPMWRVPWVLVAVFAFLVWRRAGWHHHQHYESGRSPHAGY